MKKIITLILTLVFIILPIHNALSADPIPQGDVSCALSSTGVSFGVSLTFSGNVTIGNLTYDWDFAILNEGANPALVSNYSNRTFFRNTLANGLNLSYDELLQLASGKAQATVLIFASPKNDLGLSTIKNANGKGCYVALPTVLANKIQMEKVASEAKAKAEAEAKAKAEAEAKAKAEAEAKAKAENAEKSACETRRVELSNLRQSFIKFKKTNPSQVADVNSILARLDSAYKSPCVVEVTLTDFQQEFQNLVNSALKKVTITCVKGKTFKKLKAVNPKCPKGYKKK